jgi:hemolysin D
LLGLSFLEFFSVVLGKFAMNRSATKILGVVRRNSRAADPALPVILEFQSPSAAILNAEAPLLAREIVWIVTSLVFAMMAAMALIAVDRVISVRGVVVSQSSPMLVQPLETAIVRSIEVREGQEVKAGQLLARLDPTFSSADLAALSDQASTSEAEAARLEAEAQDKPFDYAGTDPRWALQVGIYNHRKAEFEAKVENYQNRLAEADALIRRSEADALGYQQRLGVAQNIEEARKRLEAKRFGSRLETWLATDTRAEMERSLANARQTGDGARREQAALAAERDSFVGGWRADIAQKLSEARARARNAREGLNKAKLRRELTELRSEVDAVVQSVERVSDGAVLQSGERLMTLVPMNAELEVEANIAGRDSGYVHVHDPAIIKFDTFPFSQFGVAEGSVRVVSPDSFTPQAEARNPTGSAPLPASFSEPFYRSRIAIGRVALHNVPPDFHIVPGMPVTADIKVGKHTVLQYLFGAVLPIAREGLREP